MKVIMIDGPKAGEVVEASEESPSIVFPRLVPLGDMLRGGFEQFMNATFEADYYNIYRVRVLDFELAVGSMKGLGEMLDSQEWRAVSSELTRQHYAA